VSARALATERLRTGSKNHLSSILPNRMPSPHQHFHHHRERIAILGSNSCLRTRRKSSIILWIEWGRLVRQFAVPGLLSCGDGTPHTVSRCRVKGVAGVVGTVSVLNGRLRRRPLGLRRRAISSRAAARNVHSKMRLLDPKGIEHF